MKKRIMYIISLGMILVCLTGCVKFNANMEIKKDKSMSFSIIYAFDKSLFGDAELLSSEDKKEMEDNGFSVNNYEEGNFKGFTLTKNVQNIDAISTDKDVTYSLSGMLDEKDESYLFKVKKGFLKNTYTANFSFDPADSSLNDNNQNSNNNDNDDMDFDWNYDIDDNINNDFNNSNSNMDFSDLSGAMANMDLSFNVKLPYRAKSSNATTNTNNKELKWALNNNEIGSIEFKFEIYNIKNIVIVSGICLLIILLVVITIFKKRKNNKNKIVNPENSIPVSNEMNINANNNNMFNGTTLGATNINLQEQAMGINNTEIETLTSDISNISNNVSLNSPINQFNENNNINNNVISNSPVSEPVNVVNNSLINNENANALNQVPNQNIINNNFQTPGISSNLSKPEINPTINDQTNNSVNNNNGFNNPNN